MLPSAKVQNKTHTPSPTKTVAYSPYGYHLILSGVLGFNGERSDQIAGHYFLGNGYRAFNPPLMRFNSPDTMSPFRIGGLNSYGYCSGDPVNFRDPSGHLSVSGVLLNMIAWISSKVGFSKKNNTWSGFEGVSQSPPDTYAPLKRTHSVPSLMRRRPASEIIATGDKFALHGSTDGHGPSLKAGLDPTLQGSSWAQRFGKGFYAAQDVMRPWEYARDTAAKNGQKPQIFALYTENFHRLKPGLHYEYRVRDAFPAERAFGEMVIKQSAYHLITLGDVRSGRVVLPRSKEAPF
ncbi:RHS repeat-associated core domain-containing protein [Pseudomonas putida]|uniref:RHS repeat-associated core domain-containing protein n=1 Tax=Pseudomonas putida TaxID=303 RepID=A0A7V8EHZ4_PSEPU|nr:RHS repeat-associated core domain-containing protein [Pseudomonas putida]KAF0255218.1 hypothetical protein GN299_08945 [Pseudomonas putida]